MFAYVCLGTNDMDRAIRFYAPIMDATPGNGSMLALRAAHWQQVDDFHAAALLYGGSSEGAPGLRLQRQPDFYAAYVRDPDRHKLAAVCRGFTTRPGS